MVDPENLTLVLLREMRGEQGAFRQETRKRFDRLDRRIDAMHANGIKALKGFIGPRSMVERAMASVDDDLVELKRQVADFQVRLDG